MPAFLRKCGIIVLGLSLSILKVSAQELRAEVEISASSSKTPPSPSWINALRQQITHLLNQTRWTMLSYKPEERIEALFRLELREQDSQGQWLGELQISARRPVHHTDYKTTTCLIRDKELAFSYTPGEALLYRERETDHPLTMLLAYYVYYLLASDLDSYSPLGGNPLIPQLLELAQEAEGHADWVGWQTRGKGNERRLLLERFENPEEEPLRQLWYHYHRLGLDQLADQPSEARLMILQQLRELSEKPALGLPSATLLQLKETKLQELISLYRSSPTAQKAEAYTLLDQLFPGNGDQLRALH